MRHRGARRVHAAFLTTSAALCLGYSASTGVLRSGFLALASLAAAAVLAVLLARRRMDQPRPWAFVLAGLVALAVNSVDWLVQVGIQGRTVATGLVAAGTLPLGYLLLLAGAALVMSPFARLDSGGVLDAAIIGLGGASVLWTVIAQPLHVGDSTLDATRADDMVVVLLVTVIVGMIARAFVTARRARGSLGYVGLATALTLVGTVARLVTRAPDGRSAWWVELVWIVAYCALAAAALHPSRNELPCADVERVDTLSPRRLVFLGIALALNPAIAAMVTLGAHVVDLALLSVTSLALVPLVLARIAQLARRQSVAERALAHLAAHDELTGLLNRRAALQRIDDALEHLGDDEVSTLSVVFFDVDGLKVVNDEHGHGAGDTLLSTIAARLAATVRPEDTVARLGGDEFVVMSACPGDCTDALVDRIRASLEAPVVHRDLLLPAEASLGAVTARAGQFASADEILAVADARMYAEKRRHGRRGDPVDSPA